MSEKEKQFPWRELKIDFPKIAQLPCEEQLKKVSQPEVRSPGE